MRTPEKQLTLTAMQKDNVKKLAQEMVKGITEPHTALSEAEIKALALAKAKEAVRVKNEELAALRAEEKALMGEGTDKSRHRPILAVRLDPETLDLVRHGAKRKRRTPSQYARDLISMGLAADGLKYEDEKGSSLPA